MYNYVDTVDKCTNWDLFGTSTSFIYKKKYKI